MIFQSYLFSLEIPCSFYVQPHKLLPTGCILNCNSKHIVKNVICCYCINCVFENGLIKQSCWQYQLVFKLWFILWAVGFSMVVQWVSSMPHSSRFPGLILSLDYFQQELNLARVHQSWAPNRILLQLRSVSFSVVFFASNCHSSFY